MLNQCSENIGEGLLRACISSKYLENINQDQSCRSVKIEKIARRCRIASRMSQPLRDWTTHLNRVVELERAFNRTLVGQSGVIFFCHVYKFPFAVGLKGEVQFNSSQWRQKLPSRNSKQDNTKQAETTKKKERRELY